MNTAATSSSHSGPGLLAAFIPWIVYWVLVGNVEVSIATLIPLIIVAVQVYRTIQSGRSPKVLEIGTLLVFFVLTIVAFAGEDEFLERWFQPISNAALFLIALVSVLIGKPFALQYAREEVPPEYQNSPLFLATTRVITWVWVAAFAVMTISSLIPPIVDGDATMLDQNDSLSIVCYWVIPIGAIAAAALFTAWYPQQVRNRARAGSSS